MAFVKYLYRVHGIISVQHWDEAGGDLFDGCLLDDEARHIFMQAIGMPERPRPSRPAEVVALFSNL